MESSESECESEEMVLLRSLEKFGVEIPKGIASIRGLTPEALVSVSAQCLILIDELALSSLLPTSLPDSMVDKFKICTNLALAFTRLGFTGDMNYYKFLYPSEEDLFKVITFLVERLSESSKRSADPMEEGEFTNNLEGSIEEANNKGLDVNDHEETLNNLSLHVVAPELPNTADGVGLFSGPEKPEFSKDVQPFAVSENCSAEEGNLLRDECGNEANTADIDKKNVQKVASFCEEPSEIQCVMEKLQNQEKVFTGEWTSEIRHLEEELQLLKAAAEMAFDDKHPVDFHLEQLKEQVDARKHRIAELESQWWYDWSYGRNSRLRVK